MQFTLVAILSLAALAIAQPARLDDITARQSTQTQPAAEVAAMTDAQGNIITFDSASVYQAATNNGQ